MKKLLVVTFLSLIALPAFASGGWDAGFDAGWEAGWHFSHGQLSLPPLPALPPLPTLNENDDYQGGYNRGFASALATPE
jgi:hypothetical protein